MVNVSQAESSVHQRQSRAGACLQDELNAQILVTRDVLCSELSSLVKIGLEVSILSKNSRGLLPSVQLLFCSSRDVQHAADSISAAEDGEV
jgi:hypothetical protein